MGDPSPIQVWRVLNRRYAKADLTSAVWLKVDASNSIGLLVTGLSPTAAYGGMDHRPVCPPLRVPSPRFTRLFVFSATWISRQETDRFRNVFAAPFAFDLRLTKIALQAFTAVHSWC
jgi:hypothetical protein